MNTKKNVYFAAFGYAAIIGFSFLFTKIALNYATPSDILAHRFTIALIGGTIIFWSRLKNFKFTWPIIKKLSLLATFYPILFFGFQTFGLQYASSSEAGIINAVIPIITLFLAWLFLGETNNPKQIGYIALSVLGVVMIFVMKGTQATQSHMFGNFLILLSAVASSIYTILTKKLSGQLPAWLISYGIIVIAAIVFNLQALISHGMTHTISSFFQPLTQTGFILPILYLGLLSSLASSFLSAYSLSKLPASQFSIFGNLGTLITVFAGVIFLNESFSWYHIVSGILILAGVIGLNLSKK